MRNTLKKRLISLVPRGGLEPPCGYPRWILSSFQGGYTRPSLSQTVHSFNEFRLSCLLGEDEFSHLWSTKETKLSPSHVFGTTYNLVRDIAEKEALGALAKLASHRREDSVITREGPPIARRCEALRFGRGLSGG